MRVTANTFPNSLIDQLSQLSVRQNRLQNQAATGQLFQFPEDNPTAMRRVLDMQAESQTISQYQRNISREQELATASFDVMKSLKKISDKVGEIATSAGGITSPAEMTVLAKQVSQQILAAVQAANTKNRSDYLLSGTKSDTPPYQLTTDANGNVTSVTYQGNSSLAESEIAEGVTITGQVLGSNTSGSGPRGLITDSRVGADFFNHMISLQNNLLAGNKAAITATDLPQLAKDEDNFIVQYGINGSIQSRLDTAAAIATQRSGSLQSLISKEADADLAQTLVKLHETQNAYQAALQSGGTILNRSLLDYLH